MKTIITLFFYIFLMVSNVFFILRSESNNNTTYGRGLICHKNVGISTDLFLTNFIK
jgi:hypothetical protein